MGIFAPAVTAVSDRYCRLTKGREFHISKKYGGSVITDKSSGLAGRPKEPLEPAAQTVTLDQESHDEIAALAYKFWQERGCPFGSDQEDWFRAQNKLKKG